MGEENTYKELWALLRNGNSEALYALYKEFYDRLLLTGIKICRDPDSVKDAINQTFLYFWEKHETLGKAENVSGYIFSSFRRQLIADLTRQKKDIQKLEQWNTEEYKETPSPEDNLIGLQDREELKERMNVAVNKLSKRKQELLRMHYYEGLSYDEIAAKTGLTLRTIYNKINEAVKFLREELQHQNIGKQLPLSLLLVMFCF